MAGILFVLALLADLVVAVGIPINQNDSAAKIATALDHYSTRLLIIAGLCVVYIMLSRERRVGNATRPRAS